MDEQEWIKAPINIVNVFQLSSPTKRLAFNILIQGIIVSVALLMVPVPSGEFIADCVGNWLWFVVLPLVHSWLTVVTPSCWSVDGGSSYLGSVPTKLCFFPLPILCIPYHFCQRIDRHREPEYWLEVSYLYILLWFSFKFRDRFLFRDCSDSNAQAVHL